MLPMSLRQAVAHQRRQLRDALAGTQFETARVGALDEYSLQVELIAPITLAEPCSRSA